MARVGLYRKVCGIVAVATMFSSSVAYAAPVAARQIPSSSISPIVALSLFASSQSRVALCGSAAAVAATSAAATTAQGAPAQGCVLPAVDAPVVPVAEAPVAYPVAVAQAASGISPLLLGLGAIALGIGLWALLRDSDNNQPVSPN
ncbi:MAG: hypothetical protein LH465_03950 [Sphingomonas bacterium]|nr:hypothetical protein [Sphingomonas bacterium]